MLENIQLNCEQWLCIKDLPNEKWKTIKNYEGLYKISNYGRVKSLEKRHTNMGRNHATTVYKEHIMKSVHGTKGYILTGLTKNSETSTLRNHRLVAQAFIPNPNNLPEVNHKDKNKENNRVDNLEWCTTIYNIQYSHAKKVEQWLLDETKLIKNWNSLSDITRELNYSATLISKCCRGIVNQAYGYKWKYKEREEN